MSDLQVIVDNRVRLVAAVLAAGDWPAREQASEPHAVHAQAKLTRQYVVVYDDHPAVAIVNAAVADGAPLADLFAAALRSDWPTFDPAERLPSPPADETWTGHLADFYTDTAIAAFHWSDHNAAWETAAAELRQIFHNSALPAFLSRLAGRDLDRDICVAPNLVYPSLQAVVAETAAALYLILPPPRAVGESPPWRYGQGAGWVLAESCCRLLDVVLSDELAEMSQRQASLLRHGATTLFLQRALDEAAAMAYLVQNRKQHDLPELAAVVDALRDYLDDGNGRSLRDVVRVDKVTS